MNKKDLAADNLRRRFRDRAAILAATNSTSLSIISMKKSFLIGEPCPTVAELTDIYCSDSLPMEFVRTIIRHVYMLKENRLPGGNIETVQAETFLSECSAKGVWLCLCFVAEYPAMRQFGKGFDYTHFSSSFRDYAHWWTQAVNRKIDTIITEKQRRRDEARAALNGWDELAKYVQRLIDEGIDPRQGGLYMSGKSGGARSLIDRMCAGHTFNPDKTAAHARRCCVSRDDFEASARERRLHLPDWLLTPEELHARDAAF